MNDKAVVVANSESRAVETYSFEQAWKIIEAAKGLQKRESEPETTAVQRFRDEVNARLGDTDDNIDRAALIRVASKLEGVDPKYVERTLELYFPDPVDVREKLSAAGLEYEISWKDALDCGGTFSKRILGILSGSIPNRIELGVDKLFGIYEQNYSFYDCGKDSARQLLLRTSVALQDPWLQILTEYHHPFAFLVYEPSRENTINSSFPVNTKVTIIQPKIHFNPEKQHSLVED